MGEVVTKEKSFSAYSTFFLSLPIAILLLICFGFAWFLCITSFIPSIKIFISNYVCSGVILVLWESNTIGFPVGT